MFRAIFLIIVCFSLLSNSVLEFKVPEFESNAVLSDSIIWKTHQLINHEYKFLISLESDSYWRKEKTSTIALCLTQKKEWYKVEIQRNKIENRSEIKSEEKLSKKNNQIVWQLISELNESSFLMLDVDSLNISSVKMTDTVVDGQKLERIKSSLVNDGVTYRFEVISENNHRVISGYSPYHQYEYLPEIWQREVFIKFLEKYKKTLSHL